MSDRSLVPDKPVQLTSSAPLIATQPQTPLGKDRQLRPCCQCITMNTSQNEKKIGLQETTGIGKKDFSIPKVLHALRTIEDKSRNLHRPAERCYNLCTRQCICKAKGRPQRKYTPVAVEYSLQNGPSGMEVKYDREYTAGRDYFETYRRIPACT